MVIGVDEVGRGSWAGPLCVAAVAWPDQAAVTGLADSKQLSAKRRVHMAAFIRGQAAGIGIGWVSPAAIDALGLSRALQRAALCAVAQIGLDAPIIVDGRDRILGDLKAEYVIKADTKIHAVMAASIIAKVARDAYMLAIDQQFTQYQFARHVGYGTALHRQLIAQFGPCAQHRLSYAPLKELTE